MISMGIIWPEAIAPFKIVIIPMNMHKSHRVKEIAEPLYAQLKEAGVEVLFDDRKERPGVMFKRYGIDRYSSHNHNW